MRVQVKRTMRIRIGKYARVFVFPNSICFRAALFMRGYRPFKNGITSNDSATWSKMNTHQRSLADKQATTIKDQN